MQYIKNADKVKEIVSNLINGTNISASKLQAAIDWQTEPSQYEVGNMVSSPASPSDYSEITNISNGQITVNGPVGEETFPEYVIRFYNAPEFEEQFLKMFDDVTDGVIDGFFSDEQIRQIVENSPEDEIENYPMGNASKNKLEAEIGKYVDQNGDPVDTGKLVWIPDFVGSNFTTEEVKKDIEAIMQQDWYEFGNSGELFTPYTDNIGLLNSDWADIYEHFEPEELQKFSDNGEIYKIDQPLKRFSVEDGFYHA